MQKKRQHVIPRCYQKAWCDPKPPPGQTPYIWMVAKDGTDKKRKSPEKAFVEPDVYTIRLPNGERELVIEDTLGRIESDFTRLFERKVAKGYSLDEQDRATLCVFAAAMFARVKPHMRQHKAFLEEVYGKMRRMEEAHHSEPTTSAEVEGLLANAHGHYVGMSIEQMVPLYFGMRMAILTAPATDPFITSDSPTVWFNPEAHRWPPFYRSPGLAQEKIEVTMPLGPRHMLFMSHGELSGYRAIPGRAAQELNRRTRFHCDEWFVPWQGEVRTQWFDRGTPPDDRWENTAEGRQALEQKRQVDELQRRYEERLRRAELSDPTAPPND
jgi:hypothetical protein